MSEAVFIFVIAVLVVGLVCSISAIRLYGRKGYKDGFDVGVLMAFYWIENNTSCKNAIEQYGIVTSETPEDGIFFCEKTKSGKIRIPKDGKIILFQDLK